MKKLFLSLFIVATSVFAFTSCGEDDPVNDLLNDISSASINITPISGDTVHHNFKGVVATSDTISTYIVATAGGGSSMTYPSLNVNMKTKEAGSNAYNVSVPVNAIVALLDNSFNINDMRNSLGNSVVLVVSSTQYWVMTEGSIELTTNDKNAKKGSFTGQFILVDSNNLPAAAMAAKCPGTGSFNSLSVSY